MVIKGLQGDREREAETNTQILSEARNVKDKTHGRFDHANPAVKLSGSFEQVCSGASIWLSILLVSALFTPA